MRSSSGFSLVEIMVAMTILGMTVASIVTLQNRSLTTSVYSRQLTVASMVARSVMVEAYLQFHQKNLVNAIKEEKEGEVEMAGLDLKWKWMLSEVPIEFPDLSKQDKAEQGEQENPFMGMILTSLNNFLVKATRELSVEVSWHMGAREEKIYMVTHLVDFSYPIQLPNISPAALGGAL